jgi:uncharacterized membrane protein
MLKDLTLLGWVLLVFSPVILLVSIAVFCVVIVPLGVVELSVRTIKGVIEGDICRGENPFA